MFSYKAIAKIDQLLVFPTYRGGGVPYINFCSLGWREWLWTLMGISVVKRGTIGCKT